MKKILCLVLAMLMVMGLAVASAEADNWKIAILTGTASQGEEEVRAAENALAKYGAEHIITDTYPDSFMAEMETTISKLVAFAADPEVKAIVMVQGVPGATAAFTKIKEELGREDILTIVGVPQEDPGVIADAADIVLYADEGAQGDTIMEKCMEWGIEVFIHYSFPRHMAMEPIVARHTKLVENAEALGIEFYDVTAPDPTAEAGVSASQQFILEDVPRQMEAYAGKKVAFFTTNCSMQPSLQSAVLAEENAYYPQPCCPSPYHAFPGTLGLELEVGANDVALKAIASALNEKGAVGRFSTWAAPVNMVFIEAAVEYAIGYINGEITSRNDGEKLADLLNAKIEGATLNLYTDAEGTTYDNYYTVLLAPVDFADYL